MWIEKTCDGNVWKYECWDGFSVVGIAIVRKDEDAHILDINVRRDWRGKGLGSQLLKIIKEDFKGGRITVDVFKERVGWYERNGFKRVGKRGPLILMEFSDEP